jgi:hypothetical protein
VEVYLEGERLKGGYILIRTGSGNNIRWLLIKMSDDYADHSKKPFETETNSVLTGRNLEEIAEEG